MAKHITSREFTVLMALLMSIVAISIDALLPSLGMLGEDFGLADMNRTQLVISFLFGGMAVGQLVAGPLSDALGRKPVLYGGVLLYLAGSLFCYLARDFNLLLAGRLVQGLGVAGPYVTAVSVVRDKYSGRDMASVMSVIMMIFIMVPAVAPSLGLAVMHLSGWRSIFLLYIGYALFVGLWIAWRLEETLPKEGRLPFRWAAFSQGAQHVLANQTTRIYMICMGLCFGCLIGYLNASRQIFQVQFAVGDAFSLYFGGLALVLGIASLLNSRFVERLGMRPICLYAMGGVVVVSALFLMLQIVIPVSLWMFVAYAALLFFAFGLMFGNLNAIAMEPMGDMAGMASAITGAVSSLISLSIGTLIGQLYNGTLVPLAASFICFGSLAWGLMHYELKRLTSAF